MRLDRAELMIRSLTLAHGATSLAGHGIDLGETLHLQVLWER